jgi:hypothetical protein
MILFPIYIVMFSTAPNLFGSNIPTQPTQTGLFGPTSAAGQLGSTLTPNLLTSTSQPKTPLFGQTTTVASGTTPASLNLFGNTAQQSQPSLFGPGLGVTTQASTGGLFTG